MLRLLCKIAGVVALIAYPIGLWIWASHSFPIDAQTACKYAADGAQYDCAPEHVYLFALRKIGEAFSDSTFVTALATIVIAAFTGTLWHSTRGMLRVTNESLKLARDEFNASHVPELRLKHIWLATDDGMDFWGKIEAGRRIVVRLDVVNVGSAVAHIRIINFVTLVVAHGERLPQRAPYDDGNHAGRQNYEPPFPVNPGITFTQIASDNRVLTDEEVDSLRNSVARLYFIGTIEYWTDQELGVAVPPLLRQTAFCRYLKFSQRLAHSEDNGRFEKDDDPDYEYQD